MGFGKGEFKINHIYTAHSYISAYQLEKTKGKKLFTTESKSLENLKINLTAHVQTFTGEFIKVS